MSKSSENFLVPCTIGITLLMCALACAIFVGTSQLVNPEPYRDLGSQFFGTGIMLLVLSIAGGYFASYGFLNILRDSRRTDNTAQE